MTKCTESMTEFITPLEIWIQFYLTPLAASIISHTCISDSSTTFFPFKQVRVSSNLEKMIPLNPSPGFSTCLCNSLQHSCCCCLFFLSLKCWCFSRKTLHFLPFTFIFFLRVIFTSMLALSIYLSAYFKNTFLMFFRISVPKADLRPRIWTKVGYFRNDHGKHRRGVGKWEKEGSPSRLCYRPVSAVG